MKSRGDLFDKLFEQSRPRDFREQDVWETESRLNTVLDEALQLGIIAEGVLKGILAYIQDHLAKIREHLETTEYRQINLWRLHNNFCIGLKSAFTENQTTAA